MRPAPVASHSPYAKYAHPPRTPERTVALFTPLGVAFLGCALMTGTVIGLVLTHYWREILAVALLGAVSMACGWVIWKTDRRQS